ncbi:MAG: prolipoprotein diacylglyceryl transferase [Acidobacteria bacterium]|nr:prolipoprotein diacylglyceryl transferase [Acidobacteriota bacterium]MCB9397432.1 prolipoprotein diacylglyceryl transferase [Acidobacteriota bacterium]
MHPILIDFGFFQLPSYGVLLVLAFLAASWFLKREVVRMGLPEKKVMDLTVISLLLGLVGSKLLLILIDLPVYLADPKLLLGTIRSAGVLYGGIIAGGLASLWYIRKHQLPALDCLDVMAAVTPLAIGIGRLGCLSVGCCHGYAYEGPFALHFPATPGCEAPPGIGLFPIQILAFINGVLLFVGLLYWLRHRQFKGQILAGFFAGYSLIRFIEEFFRGDTVRGLYFNNTVSTSQLIAIGLFVFALFLYFSLQKRATS